jgi:hypothetical protein
MFSLQIAAILVIFSSCVAQTEKEKLNFIKENYQKIESNEKKEVPLFELEKLDDLINFPKDQ